MKQDGFGSNIGRGGGEDVKEDMVAILERKPEDKLAADGWERQTTLSEPRLSECVEMYEELGFEVHLEPVHPEQENRCMKCYNPAERFKTIYTRKKS